MDLGGFGCIQIVRIDSDIDIDTVMIGMRSGYGVRLQL